MGQWQSDVIAPAAAAAHAGLLIVIYTKPHGEIFPKTDDSGESNMGPFGDANWKIFQDSIHGPMQFHPLLVKIIDTEEFQRLRYIKQLAMSYWVYPAGSHNRFEHSIGVCHLAGTMLEELEKNSDSILMQKIALTDSERLCVQIAGLCHDLGHGPFSHTWEIFLSWQGKNWSHEKTSCDMIDFMLAKDNGALREKFRSFGLQEKDEKLIKNLIMGDPELIDDKTRTFLFQIVSNKFNDVDVDKWDYFLRDGQNLNVKTSFDYERCLKLCKVVLNEDGSTSIAFRDIEKYSIAGMFRLRADLYLRAYQHRVAKCLETMIIDAFRKADEFFHVRGSDGREYKLSSTQENIEVFRQLTDHVHQILQWSHSPDLKPARDILKRISERDLFSFVGEWQMKGLPTENDEALGLTPKCLRQKDLHELQTILGEEYTFTQLCVNQGKYLDPLKNIQFFSKKGRSEHDVLIPQMSLELPYYKLMVFCKEKSVRDFTEAKGLVKNFLKDKRVLKE